LSTCESVLNAATAAGPFSSSFDPRPQIWSWAAERPLGNPVDEREAPLRILDEREAGRFSMNERKISLAALHLRFGGAQRGTLGRLLHRALHGGRETGQVGLQYVIGRPAAQRFDRGFLADRSETKMKGTSGLSWRTTEKRDSRRISAVRNPTARRRGRTRRIRGRALLRLDAAKLDAQSAACELGAA
jgi:hypothetical protein